MGGSLCSLNFPQSGLAGPDGGSGSSAVVAAMSSGNVDEMVLPLVDYGCCADCDRELLVDGRERCTECVALAIDIDRVRHRLNPPLPSPGTDGWKLLRRLYGIWHRQYGNMSPRRLARYWTEMNRLAPSPMAPASAPGAALAPGRSRSPRRLHARSGPADVRTVAAGAGLAGVALAGPEVRGSP